VGLSLTIAGSWIRAAAAGEYGYIILLLGQTTCAIAQPFILNAPPKLAFNWFPPGERTIASKI
jgi:hypothetical protein